MGKPFEIVLMKGDGIGPEVVDSAVEVLAQVSKTHGVSLNFREVDAGADFYRRTGESMRHADMEALPSADAVLLGAMGLPSVRKADGTEIAPQIDIRERFGLFASLRPCRLFPGVASRVKADKIDMLVIREISEGLFAGRHDVLEPSDEAVGDRLVITRKTSEKLFTVAFEQARLRRTMRGTPGHVTLLDKSNVLRSNAFMRKVFDEVAARYPDVGTDRLYIDAGSMMFVTHPERYDVVVSENVFGDIISEIAAGVVGGLGVAPSADINETMGVFQPSHGSAPDIAGTGLANPIATILSAAMMLEWLGQRHGDADASNAAGAVQDAVERVLASGPRTKDIGGDATGAQVTAAVVNALR